MINLRRAAATAATALMAFNTGANACTTGCGQTPAPTFTYNAGVDVKNAVTTTLSNTGSVTGNVDVRNANAFTPTNTFSPTVQGSTAQAVGDVKVNVAGDTYTAPKPAANNALAFAPPAGICDKTGAFAITLYDVSVSLSGSNKQGFCLGAVYTIVPNLLRLGYDDAATNYLLQGDEGARTAFTRAAQMEANEAARAAAGLPPLGKYARYLATDLAPLEVKPAVAAPAPAAYTP